MTREDEVFLLSKVNLIENVCVNQVAILAMLHSAMTHQQPADLLEVLEHNLNERIRVGSRVAEGDVSRIDPLAVQAEMLRQVSPLFQRIKQAIANYRGEDGLTT